jgi:flavin-dependent dehydrogenase
MEMETKPTAGTSGGSSSRLYDVVILGGGLAGLTLSLQLKRARPETSIAVVEKRKGPAPEAAFKVGESSVEVAAYYFREIVGMADHLDNEQIRKVGLRFFFPAGDNSDITQRVEFPTPSTAAVYTHQIDRGRFENELWKRAVAHGVDATDGAFVDRIDLGKDFHSVEIVQGGPGGDRSTVRGRWLVDAAGRAFLLKRKLGLERPVEHKINAAWFRLEGGIDIEDWTDDTEWIERVTERGRRYRSTNHLTGPGYWVWLIQLSSGPISIGVCSDPRFHPWERFSDLDGMLDWLKEHEPQLAGVLEQRREQVEDYLKIEHFSFGAERVFSPERWCLTGEAGVFLDPLYSPGSDFITYSNTFITQLIVSDLSGNPPWPSSAWRRARARAFFWMSAKAAAGPPRKPPLDVVKLAQKIANDSPLEFANFIYLRFFDAARTIYQDEYQLFGNSQVMLTKVAFDTCAYWANPATLYMHGKFEPTFLASTVTDAERFSRLMARMAALFREWHARENEEHRGVSVFASDFEAIRHWVADLAVPLSDEEFVAKYRDNIEHIFALAVVIFHRAAQSLPQRPGEDVPINALGVSLDPSRWEKDGLFSPPGISLRKAREMVPGVDELFLERREALAHATG